MTNPVSFQIPTRVKRLWDQWNLRSAVLISLFFQVVLILSARSRKRTGNKIVIAIIWSFYLLADWIAAFAVGLISNGQSSDCPEKFSVSKDLAAFWAPFLLLHLGGPDTITAFSLEDNELWIRHLLGLVIQLVAVAYVFTQSIPNQFWIATILIFFAGAIKYAERTRALYQACLGNFERSMLPSPDSGPNYAQLMEEYSAMEASDVPVKIEIVKEPEKGNLNEEHLPEEELNDIDVVLHGYRFYKIFRGLIVDNMLSFHERNESRTFFFQRNAVDAFRVLEVELNFMYDALYTKMALVHCKTGYFFRSLCTVLIVACLFCFASHSKHNVHALDIYITYVLLAGAVFLDFYATLNSILSDWTVTSRNHPVIKGLVSAALLKLSFGKRSRWCNSMSQHSLINFCLKKRSKWLNKVADFFGLKDVLDEFQYKKATGVKNELKEFIFKDLKAKALKAKEIKAAKEIYSSKGDFVLQDYPSHYPYPSISSSVSDEVEYDESLLMWHVATELCYNKCTNADPNREFCKVISDYMLYLLVMRPTFMSAVAGIAQIRFQDTCEEAKKFFYRWHLELKNHKELACDKLLNVNTVVKPVQVKGDRSKSVLFDSCMLAKELNKLGDTKRWEMMSKVWLEIMCYAASHCRPNAHAQQLSKGGELITFVWLQMAHFGLGEQFRIEAGHARAKLIVSK